MEENRKYRYYFQGKEVKLNDVLYIKTDTILGQVEIPVTINSEEVIINLLAKGIDIQKVYIEVPTKEEVRNTRLGNAIQDRFKTIPTDLNYYLNRANNANLNDVCSWMHQYAPLQLYTLYSRFIAIELDKAYENNIRNSKYVYCIDDIGGKPWKVEQKKFTKEEWINFINNVPCFRTEVDLIVCQKLLKDLKKHVWSGKARKLK